MRIDNERLLNRWYEDNEEKIESGLVVPDVIPVTNQDICLRCSFENGIERYTSHVLYLDFFSSVMPLKRLELTLDQVFEYKDRKTNIQVPCAMINLRARFGVIEDGGLVKIKSRSCLVFGFVGTRIALGDCEFEGVQLPENPSVEFSVVALGEDENEQFVVIGD